MKSNGQILHEIRDELYKVQTRCVKYSPDYYAVSLAWEAANLAYFVVAYQTSGGKTSKVAEALEYFSLSWKKFTARRRKNADDQKPPTD